MRALVRNASAPTIQISMSRKRLPRVHATHAAGVGANSASENALVRNFFGHIDLPGNESLYDSKMREAPTGYGRHARFGQYMAVNVGVRIKV